MINVIFSLIVTKSLLIHCWLMHVCAGVVQMSDLRLGLCYQKFLGLSFLPPFELELFSFFFFFLAPFLFSFFFSPCIDLVYSHFICERVCLVRTLTLACIYIKKKKKKKNTGSYIYIYIYTILYLTWGKCYPPFINCNLDDLVNWRAFYVTLSDRISGIGIPFCNIQYHQ